MSHLRLPWACFSGQYCLLSPRRRTFCINTPSRTLGRCNEQRFTDAWRAGRMMIVPKESFAAGGFRVCAARPPSSLVWGRAWGLSAGEPSPKGWHAALSARAKSHGRRSHRHRGPPNRATSTAGHRLADTNRGEMPSPDTTPCWFVMVCKWLPWLGYPATYLPTLPYTCARSADSGAVVTRPRLGPGCPG